MTSSSKQTLVLAPISNSYENNWITSKEKKIDVGLAGKRKKIRETRRRQERVTRR